MPGSGIIASYAADSHVEALNYALDGLPSDRVRVHICWGNYEGPHVCDIAMDKVFPTLMSVGADYLLFETSNPRHAHEWEVFANRRDEIPENKILVNVLSLAQIVALVLLQDMAPLTRISPLLSSAH